tara:strand:- start:6044 stop:7159 length:1116 start_codon:yes stop_codon:yes gene_type:complete
MSVKKKKIVLLSSTLAGGGAEGVCVSIANSFANNGWRVDLIVLNLKNEAYLERVSTKINIIVLNINHARNSGLFLLKYILKNKPKVLLVFNYELSVILIILKTFLRLNIKIISRNINVLSINLKELKKQSFWLKYIVTPLIRYFYHKMDHIINQCSVMREDLLSVHPQLDQFSSIIYNPISSYISDYVSTHNLDKIKKENYLLCVGRLEKQKAFHYAIKGFAEIAQKHPNLRLKIVGEGSLEHELKQEAVRLRVSDRVDFEGFQKNIIKYYLYAKGTILTSLYEGYPNVLIESIALNTPVIAFDCPSGPSEIIQDGINGYLVNHKDVNDLKKKILTTLSKKFIKKDMQISLKKNNISEVFKYYRNLVNSFI